MKRIYFFMFLSVWMFAACSSTSGTVKTDASPAETPQAVEATAPAPAGDSQPMESTAQAPASEAVTGDTDDNVF